MLSPTDPTYRVKQRQHGFTMVEIFIVLGLVVILALLGTPAFRDMTSRFRMNSAARHMLGHVKIARVLAVTRNHFTRVVVTEKENLPPTASTANLGLYRVEELIAGVWTSVDDPVYDGDGAPHSVETFPDDNCNYPEAGEYCVDLKVKFPAISILWMDPVPVTAREAIDASTPAIFFGPDGFVANADADFLAGGDPQGINILLGNKRGVTPEGRIIRVDRAGGSRLISCVGTPVDCLPGI